MIMQVASSLERLSFWWFPIFGNVFKLLKIREEINLECMRFVNLVIVGGLDSSERVQMIVVFKKNISVKEKDVSEIANKHSEMFSYNFFFFKFRQNTN